MLDPDRTCLNVGLCRHVWVVFGQAVTGGSFLKDWDEGQCPRCDRSGVWVWAAIVGGDPKKRNV